MRPSVSPSRACAFFVAAVLLVLVAAGPVRAQRGPADGHVSIGVDHLPNLEDTTELRARLFVERDWTPGPWRIRAAVSAEGLAADRDRTRRDGHLQVREATVGWSGGAFDVRAGVGTIVWGRLDEVQPTDVINPLDASKYLLEGRAEARLPVAHARVRWFAGEKATVEAVWVPLFTRGRYDVLDEASSPFNLLADAERCPRSPACPPVAQFIRREPERSLDHSQGGARLSATSGRVDWAVSVYSGFPGFGRIAAGPIGLPPGTPPDFIAPVLVFETYPRFTMIGGDAETVRGDWAIRGEMALTTGDTVVLGASPLGSDGHSLRAGMGADRKAGAFRLSGTMLIERRVADADPALGIAGGTDTNVSLVVGGDRGFARDTRKVKVFGAWNVADSSGFARTIGTWSLRDNLSLEGSVGWFFGQGDDTISRFADRDFVTVSLKTYF
jgi:uncharacterized protein DUF1302